MLFGHSLCFFIISEYAEMYVGHLALHTCRYMHLSVQGVMCGWVSKGFLKKELVVEGSVRPQHQVNVCAVRFEL